MTDTLKKKPLKVDSSKGKGEGEWAVTFHDPRDPNVTNVIVTGRPALKRKKK